MKEDKEKSLENCEIESSVIESEESQNNENDKELKVAEPSLINNLVLNNNTTEPPSVSIEESSGNDNDPLPINSDIIESERTETVEVETNLCPNLNENKPDPDGDEEPCETKLVLRPRRTEVLQNGEDDFKYKKSKNNCRKTERKSAIKPDGNWPVVESTAISPTSTPSELNSNLSSETEENIDGVNDVKQEYSNETSEPINNAPISVIIPKPQDENSKSIPFIKSKENIESDSKVTSSCSDSGLVEIPKKRRRRRDTWWTKKKKRKSEGNQKNIISIPEGGFNWKEANGSTDSHDSTEKKTKEFAIPSPSLADINIKAAIPESTATSAKLSKPNLCLCRKKPKVFISGNSNSTDLYCQALDCIDSRIVGCCNTIPSQDVGLYRASKKAAFQMMCDVHQERLLRHNCCPGCGLFCTQGKYMMCKSWHHFHRLCFIDNNKNNVVSCPHCGDTQLKAVTVSIQASKDPVFLPLQKPIRNMKSAKMTISRGNVQMQDEDDDPAFDLPESLFNLDGNGNSSQNGFSQVLQRNKLAHLLNIACSFSKICYNNRYSYKSLYTAAQNGEIEKLLKIIASGLNPNYVFEENNSQTALHVAAGNGHLPAVHILLQAKAQINVFDGEQNTPLIAAINAKHNDVVKYLIKCGADLLLKGEDGMTPLHIAAKCGNVGACFHLLNGTHLPARYIDSLDDGGWTPMVWASEFNHLEVVRFLISRGADPLIKDAEQNIALHWAAFGGSVDIVEMFLNDGSDINAVNVHGDTPLHIAARQHKYSCVLLLLARGARSDLKNKNGEQPRDCSVSTSDIYKGITLNMEISALLTRFQDRSPKIVSNDISRGKERNQIQCVNAVDDESEPGDFVYVSESCFTSKISVDRTITSLQSCKCTDVCSSDSCTCGNISAKCWYDSDGRLKHDFNYADPPPIFECNQACHCNRITCRNRVVQNGITCRFQLFKTKERGWGIRTLNQILKGTFVCEYVGEIISDWEADHREDDSYLFDLENRDGETYCIDARYYGNIARFINHMCVPNVIPVHIFVDHQDLRFPRIAFFANRDISPNEELGYNYGDKFWVIKWKSFTCVCGSEKCLYSENTIKTTLDNYQKKLSEENP